MRKGFYYNQKTLEIIEILDKSICYIGCYRVWHYSKGIESVSPIKKQGLKNFKYLGKL